MSNDDAADKPGPDSEASTRPGPPDFSRTRVADPNADPRPPIARCHAVFQQLDRTFGQLGAELQKVEHERAQLVWLLMLVLKRNGGTITITKGEIADLDPLASFTSVETEIGYTYQLHEGDRDESTSPDTDGGGDPRH